MVSAESLDNNIAVIGTGYVGVVTGACLANQGFDVTCVDLPTPAGQEKVDLINAGRAPIVEHNLEPLICEGVRNGNLRATTNLGRAVKGAGIVLVSVGTPSAIDGSANLDYVFSAVGSIGEHARSGAIVATRSTVPVGTTRRIGRMVPGLHAVSNPEFLAEGTAVKDTMNPSRIVIGTDLIDEVGERMKGMWGPFFPHASENDLLITDPESSETVKLTSNFQLALQVIGTNTVAEMCELTGADYRVVEKGVGRDPRIGRFLKAGPGYGGSCFPKDVRALSFLAEQLGIESSFLKTLNETNEHHKRRWFEKINEFFGEKLEGKHIAVWGLSFKPGTDDVRESAALAIIPMLNKQGARVTAFDPLAVSTTKRELGDNAGMISYACDQYEALRGADALLILTDSEEYEGVDLDRAKILMNDPVIFDVRSIYELGDMQQAGFYYNSIGRRVVDGRQEI